MAPDFCPTMTMQPLLLAKNLSRSFGDFQAVKPVDLILNSGEIAILSGPNGAGKSTLLYCLSGILRPTSGNVLIESYDLYQQEQAAKQRLAFVPDVPRFYPELTCWEHVYFICMAYHVEPGWEERAAMVLKELSLWDYRNQFPHKLSRGLRLKMGISMALIRPFSVLIMDEPTSALDPASVELFIERLLNIRQNGKAILISSHDRKMIQALNGHDWQMEQGSLRTE